MERNQLTKCDFVVEQLKEKIISGAYRSGEQLPPEAALCEMFEVSRITVREALKKLNMMGLVEIKQGKGTFVKSVDLGLFMKPLLQMIDFDDIDVETIFSAKEYIEGGTAFLAAQNRSEGELAALETILGNLHDAIHAQDMELINRYDKAFHQQVATAAHNSILFACMVTLEEINTACVKHFNKYLALMENCYQEHYEIFIGIKEQDVGKARAAMTTHTLNAKAFLDK